MRSKRAVTARVVIAALIGGVLIAVGLMAVTALSFVVAYIFGFGLITFLTYGYDKFRAIRHGRRVPEPALQLLSVLGGALDRGGHALERHGQVLDALDRQVLGEQLAQRSAAVHVRPAAQRRPDPLPQRAAEDAALRRELPPDVGQPERRLDGGVGGDEESVFG